MKRAAGAALLLLLVAAGCGGESTRSAALSYARQFGAKNPRVVRIERVVAVPVGPADVVLLRTKYCFNGTPQVPGKCGETWAQFELQPGSHKLAGGASFGGGGPGTKAIDEARKARPMFGVFPDINELRVQCRVPTALVPGHVEGACYSEAGLHSVSFVVGWPLSRPSGTRHHGGWLVHLGPSGKVIGMTIHRHGPVDTWRVSYRRSLRQVAARYAKELGDPHPQRTRLQIAVPATPPFNAPVDVIELWGNFICDPANGCTIFPSCGAPVAGSTCVRRGHYARIEIDWSSRDLRGFQLSPKAPQLRRVSR